MIAGVLLGPSLLGWLAPSVQKWLFPPQAMTIFFAVSQVGLSIYMFLVGLEFRRDLFLGKARSAAAVSLAGMVTPFLLGGAIGYVLLGQAGMFGDKVTTVEAILYMGASMCITAFPMLARIIYERGLSGTALGTLALAAGAIDDAAAWCILAVVLASFGGSWNVAALAIGGGIGYGILVLTVGRVLLARLGRTAEERGSVNSAMLAFTLTLVMLGSWFTDAVGIYAVFGAFILGVAMPRGTFATAVQQQVEPLTVVLLLPLFFTYSGLNTRLDMVDTPYLWMVSLIVLAAACLGKAGACYGAARLNGEDHKTSMAVGTLMNARGLMELIILNIGLQKGVIKPTLFSIMVVMAIATTLMASPIFEWLYGREARKQGLVGDAPLEG
ncbi:MAG TPA: cation/H(+) antiporter [Verrucomicrobiales bacterium]|nr:cation/H(+) antiporter [Verrucomicrobiales bacterium]